MQLSASPWTQFALSDPKTHRYALGLIFILLQCIIWILAAIITQYLYEVEQFESPFLMSYIGMSLLAVLLPIKIVTDRLGMTSQIPDNNKTLQAQVSFDSLDHELTKASQYSDYYDIASRRTHDLIYNQQTHWNHRKHILAACYIAPAMFAADWAFNTALAHTSVASATVLVSTQSVLVFLFAVCLRLEGYTHAKLLGVLLSVAGTALTALQDSSQDNDDATMSTRTALFGDIVAVLAAVAYAVYTIQVRVFCPQDEELYSMQLLLGYIGCVCLVPLLPVAIYIGATRVHLTWFVCFMIFIKGTMDFVMTDYLLFRAIILTDATIATVGLGLTIPMAFFADWILGKGVGTILSFAGAVAVTIGFLIVNLAVDDTVEKANRDAHDSRTDPLAEPKLELPQIV